MTDLPFKPGDRRSMTKWMQADARRMRAAERRCALANGYGPRQWAEWGRLVEYGKMAGYRYAIARNSFGALCGYLELPYNHPCARSRHAREATKRWMRVHGGVTFVGMSERRHGKRRPWWFGFDCCHATDAIDPQYMDEETKRADALLREKFGHGFMHERLEGPLPAVVRSVEYVRGEIAAMSAQARASARAGYVTVGGGPLDINRTSFEVLAAAAFGVAEKRFARER